ncbi:uncharacterized protein LOC108137824 [Drosophila elegans]|uniref:uncharacterized protein LOC108137824 n=1 Tax=Drosophila elegans TaxID=30023 RepID=UPI0007E83383|nr:uncharacterized protein LOC108137824 [Drosophila elegans]
MYLSLLSTYIYSEALPNYDNFKSDKEPALFFVQTNARGEHLPSKLPIRFPNTSGVIKTPDMYICMYMQSNNPRQYLRAARGLARRSLFKLMSLLPEGLWKLIVTSLDKTEFAVDIRGYRSGLRPIRARVLYTHAVHSWPPMQMTLHFLQLVVPHRVFVFSLEHCTERRHHDVTRHSL